MTDTNLYLNAVKKWAQALIFLLKKLVSIDKSSMQSLISAAVWLNMIWIS